MVRLFFAAFVASLFMCSCSPGNDEGDITVLKEVNNSLIQSNGATKLSTNNIFESLKGKTRIPETSDRAAKWLFKAEKVRQLTNDIIKHIEKIKSDLVEEAGFNPQEEEKPKSARQAVQHIFNEHKEGQLLHEKLALYKKDLIAVDSLLRQYMINNISITGSDMISKEESFTNRYFNTTLLGAVTMLNKIENDIRLTENKLTEFCNDNVTGCNLGLVFDSYYPIISQNATIVKPGEDMEIKAGIGAYNREPKPVIAIAGKEIPLRDKGYSVYNFKASSKPGTYNIPVRIEFFDQTMGKEVIVTETIKYTVRSN